MTALSRNLNEVALRNAKMASLTVESWPEHEREKALAVALGMERGGFWAQSYIDEGPEASPARIAWSQRVHFFQFAIINGHPVRDHNIAMNTVCEPTRLCTRSLLRRVPVEEIGITGQLVCGSCWRLVVVDDL